jgi:mono/diheme cytochrome c family protein
MGLQSVVRGGDPDLATHFSTANDRRFLMMGRCTHMLNRFQPLVRHFTYRGGRFGLPARPTWRTSVSIAAVIFCGALAFGQPQGSQTSNLHTGRDIFFGGCITCHGPDGRGTLRSTIGFEPPSTFPDFTDCSSASREPDHDWKAIITNGGPARGFSEIMPSFAEALTAEQIDMVIQFLRGFCREDSWPRGDLNLPRALVTEKAFPEDEAVVTTGVNTKGSSGTDHTLTYERRFGAGNQIEVSFPFSFQNPDSGGWNGGVGDIALGYKRLLFSSLHSGSILSVQGEAVLPTGNRTKDFGTGVTIFETFVSYGQLLPSRSFFQFQSGAEFPTDTSRVNRAVYWRAVFGRSMNQGEGLGRTWTPMLELLADREFASGERINWDLLPQLQVTLSRRQHIRANAGIRIPANDFDARPVQVVFYLLWDWFDGGLREGWR